MRNLTLKVTKFEIIRQIKKPTFWIAILAMPILICGGLFISTLFNQPAEAPTIDEKTKIAITDESGILPADIPFTTYSTKDAGIEAVKSNTIDYYYYIPANFDQTKKAEVYHVSEGLGLFDQNDVTIKKILAEYAQKDVSSIDAIALSGDFVVEDIKYTSDGELSNSLGKAIIPALFIVAFFIYICAFGNRMLMAVVEEKENRVSEMILTSVSSKHLIVGKILALLVLGTIQILALIVPLAIVLLINTDNEMISLILSNVQIEPLSLICSILIFLFSILLFAGLCTLIGAITPTAKDASQFFGPIIIGIVVPLYFSQSFMSGEVNGLIEFLTFFPLSAPIALMARLAVGSISTIALIIGIVELVLLSVIIVKAAITTFQKNAINFSIALPKFLKR